MNVQQVQELRKLFNTKQTTVFCGETIYKQGAKDGAHLVWDDAEQLVYFFRIGNYRDYTPNSVIIEGISYDMINTMSIPANIDVLKGFITAIKNKNLIDDKEAAYIYNMYSHLTYDNNLMHRGNVGFNPTMTREDYYNQHHHNILPNGEHDGQMVTPNEN